MKLQQVALDGGERPRDPTTGFSGKVIRLFHQQHNAANTASEAFFHGYFGGTTKQSGQVPQLPRSTWKKSNCVGTISAVQGQAARQSRSFLKPVIFLLSFIGVKGMCWSISSRGNKNGVPGMPKLHSYGIVWQPLALIPHLDKIHDRLVAGEMSFLRFEKICDAYGIVVSGKWWTSNSSEGDVRFTAVLTEDERSAILRAAHLLEVRFACSALHAIDTNR